MEENCKDLRNLIRFLEENMEVDKKYSGFVVNKYDKTNYLPNIFDEDNRIVTINPNDNSITRYILIENDKLLKINYKLLYKDFEDRWDVYAATHELFSDAKDFKILLHYDYDGVGVIDIMDDSGRRINNNGETLSKFNRRVFSDGVKIVHILSPVTIDELNEKLHNLTDLIKEKKLSK